ncbi:uncharacterized protein [Penaeus vannamei]|uniref:uncharacterized protein n=1 Tax=Penaeus vannamei TaxID=6689 RepID=UPI00387F8ACA
MLADRLYPESQCGLRSERSTIDMISSFSQLQEKCREQNQPLYIAFIDLTKAFFKRIGCPERLLSIIQSFHVGMKGVVQFNGTSSTVFDVKSGLKQGSIYFAIMLMHASQTSTEGIYLHTRFDGGALQQKSPPTITINNYLLDIVQEFTYLGSTVTDSLDMDPELTKCVWENRKLTTNTKMAVYRACVLSTLLYDSECWTVFSS